MTFQACGSNLSSLYKFVNANLERAVTWFNANELTLNAKKTKYNIFKNKKSHFHPQNLSIGGEIIERIGEDCVTKSFKFLGHMLDDQLTWSHHCDYVRKKISSANFALSRTKNLIPIKARLNVYNSLIHSHLNYGSIVYGSANIKLIT